MVWPRLFVGWRRWLEARRGRLAVTIDVLLEGWHDFYVAAVGASAVLLGLTFVGLSIHVERRALDVTRRGLAIGSATSLIYTLIASLVMLVPEGIPYVQGIGLVLIGVLGTISASAALRYARRGSMSRTILVFQFLVPFAAIGLLLIAGIALAFSLEPALWGAGGVVLLLIVAGTQSAWDLLFRFAPQSGVDDGAA